METLQNNAKHTLPNPKPGSSMFMLWKRFYAADPVRVCEGRWIQRIKIWVVKCAFFGNRTILNIILYPFAKVCFKTESISTQFSLNLLPTVTKTHNKLFSLVSQPYHTHTHTDTHTQCKHELSHN